MPNIIMTLIGPDHPGLVESLAAVIKARGANWTESRMAHLGGQFAGILRIETAHDKIDGLVRDLEQLQGISLTFNVETDDPDAAVATDAIGEAIDLELIGNDRPGIVAEISCVFSELGINVEAINTECKAAPMSGGQLFHASATLQLPAETSLSELRSRLEGIAADLMVDITIAQVDG